MVKRKVGHEGIPFGSEWSGQIVLSAGVTNLFDRLYASSITINGAGNRYFEPAPGRSFYLNARIDFGKASRDEP